MYGRFPGTLSLPQALALNNGFMERSEKTEPDERTDEEVEKEEKVEKVD